MEDKKDTGEKETVIDRAKKFLSLQSEMWKTSNDIGEECLEAVAGEQWEEEELESRGDERPVITINKLANPLNIVVNKNAQDMARLKVAPFENADKDTAEIINGLLRHIQYSDKSDAQLAFSHGFFNLVASGKGFWRVESEYCHDMSMDQELMISKIDDSCSVFMEDEDATKNKRSVIITFMSEELFESKYGKHSDGGSWDVDAIQSKNSQNNKMVVEYWEVAEEDLEIHKIEIVQDELAEMSNDGEINDDIESAIDKSMQYGKKEAPIRVVTSEELKVLQAQYGELVQVLNSRTSKKRTVTQYIFCGDTEIEKNEWAGKYIPIIGAFSRKFKKRNGDFFFKPMVFDALDPQKMYNFDKSQQAEFMMKAPKNMWSGYEGQFDGHEQEYEEANINPVGYLESKLVYDENGSALPPPQLVRPPEFPVAYTQTMLQDSEEIKATIGMFDPSLGAQGNVDSGRGIIALKQQGNLATYHFTQFFNTAMRFTGLVLVDLIPRIYDTARTIRILGEDMVDKVVKINQESVDDEGKPVLYNLTVGTYDVKVETGPSANTRREENFSSVIEMAKAVPAIAATAPDLIVRNADFEAAEEISARLRAGLNPQLLAQAEKIMSGENKREPSPEQQAMQKMGQQMQQMQGVVKQLGQENQMLKKRDEQVKVMIAKIKAQTDLQTTQMDNKTDIVVEQIKQRGGRF